MSELLNEILKEGNEQMDESISHLQHGLTKIRAGKASPAIVSSLMVDYYGSPTPMAQVANISSTDSRTLAIQPWEKSMLGPIEKAIFEANLGITPMNNGEVVIINIPPLTEERRLDLVKQSKALGEDGKISLRNIRHKLMDAIKTEVKDGYPEDAGKKREEEVQDYVKASTIKITRLLEAKEKDILTV